MGGEGKAAGQVTPSHRLQSTWAEPPQPHPLGAAARKGEGERPGVLSLVWCL